MLRAPILALLAVLSFFLISPPLEAYRRAPQFTETDIRGQVQSLEKYAGQPLVIYFWATWCPWCVKDVQAMKAAYQKFHPQGIGFISVSLDKNLSSLEEFVTSRDINYPVLFDGKGWDNELARRFGIHSTPRYVLLDRNHEIRFEGRDIHKLDQQLKKHSLLKR